MVHSSRIRRRGAQIAAIGIAVALGVAGCSNDVDSPAVDTGTSDTATADTGTSDTGVDETGVDDGSGMLDSAALAGSEQALDAIVADMMSASGVPGVAVGVVHDGEVVIAKGYGVREAGTEDEVDAETVFQLASLSKPIGSTVVAGVVGRGAITWDQPVVDELPDFELSDEYVTANVTVADLYSHRSGLPGASAGNDLEQIGYDQAEIIERLRHLPLAPFRATYSYSNFGLTVGGLAAAAAYGAPFADTADEVLFDPAGMTSTSFRHDDFAAEENAAKLHVRVGGEFQSRFTRDADAQAPAGGASSNVADLNRWMILQLDEGRLDGEQIIDAEALSETKRPRIASEQPTDLSGFVPQSGLGWGIRPSDVAPELVQWSHSGAFVHGAGTVVRLLPSVGLGVVVLTNAQPVGLAEAIADAYVDTVLNGEMSLDWFGDGWAPVFAGLLAPTEPAPPDAPRPARAVSAYVGTYTNDYIGDVVVREGADGLEMAWGPDGVTVLALEHFDADTFLVDGTPQIEKSRSLIGFDFVDGSDVAAEVVVSPGDDVPSWMRLRRVD